MNPMQSPNTGVGRGLSVRQKSAVNREFALVVPIGYVLEHIFLKNADGTPARCRVNGKCKTWKTRPTEFRLPVKHGLRNCFYIDENNATHWTR